MRHQRQRPALRNPTSNPGQISRYTVGRLGASAAVSWRAFMGVFRGVFTGLLWRVFSGVLYGVKTIYLLLRYDKNILLKKP